MHVVFTVMVMVVTFFAMSMVVVVFVALVLSPFHQQRFHSGQLTNRHLFLRRDLFSGFLHERFHLRTNPDD